ncbi:MAG: carbon-nitrogen hydrolase [Chitinophagaceae bacterium]|nr:carbon-nitrogen hydrolase [Chitinophagaceae bacterium]
MKIGTVQTFFAQDTSTNTTSVIKKIRQCASEGAELVILSELHNSRYFCQCEDVRYFSLAETIPGASTTLFGKVAKELSIVIVLSLFEKRAPGLYHNTAVVLEKTGEIQGIYRKMHIPDDPGFYEKFYFTPGDTGFTPIKTSVGNLGVLICWDQWYPEAARLMTLAGADMLIYPTAIGWDKNDSLEEQKRQQEAWITIQRSHAIANGIPVISVNRVGKEEDESKRTSGIVFWGNSMVVGAQGELLYTADSSKEAIHVIDIDTQRTSEVRNIWPFLRDRRIDAYNDILKRWIEKRNDEL